MKHTDKLREEYYERMYPPECTTRLVRLIAIDGSSVLHWLKDNGTKFNLEDYVYHRHSTHSTSEPYPIFKAKMGYMDFSSAQGIEPPERLSEGRSSMTIEPLIQLHGKLWCDEALVIVHSLRPSKIRVGKTFTLDCCTNRVTVTLDDDNETIWKITMEVNVYPIDEELYGSDLMQWMHSY